YTRNRWKNMENGKRKSRNFDTLKLQMRRSAPSCKMLSKYFTLFIMIPEGYVSTISDTQREESAAS
ncbi:hypothetical protein Tco_1182474, partial [Tanacetum coccineum]